MLGVVIEEFFSSSFLEPVLSVTLFVPCEGALSAGHTQSLVPSSAGELWVLPSLALASPSSLVAFPHHFLCLADDS